MSGLGISALTAGALLAIALGAARLVRGPTQGDRIVAQDVLFAGGIALCLLAALQTERSEFLDVALGLALTSFVATLCWSRALQQAARCDGDREERP